MTTYSDLYNKALSEIKAICENVSNFSNVPSTVKSGYTRTASATGSDPSNGNHTKTITARFRVSNPIPQVSASTVESQFESYINSCGYKNVLKNTTTPRGEILFATAVTEFVTAKICTVQGSNSSKVCVYNQNTSPTIVSYSSDTDITTTDTNINSSILKNTSQIKVNYIYEFE